MEKVVFVPILLLMSFHVTAGTSGFCVARTEVLEGPVDEMDYPDTVYNDWGQWGQDSANRYTAPAAGTYFVHLSAGARAGQRVNLQLFRWPYFLLLYRNSTSNTAIDTMSRDVLAPLSAADQFWINMQADSSVYSDTFGQTSLSGFNLDEYMTETVAFFGAFQGVYANVGTAIPFPDEKLDTYAALNSGRFTAPVAGIYYFTVCLGLDAGKGVRVAFLKNSVTTVAELSRRSTRHNSVDTISKSVMAYMEVGDYMEVFLLEGETFNSDGTVTTFGGFLYSPWYASATAWCVHKLTSQLTGPTLRETLTFDTSTVNTGAMFNFNTHTVQITTSGLYFLHWTVGALASQQAVDTPVNVRLMVEGVPSGVAADAVRSTNYNNGDDALSRGLLAQLDAGMTVRLEMAINTGVLSNAERQTTFLGFLVGQS